MHTKSLVNTEAGDAPGVPRRAPGPRQQGGGSGRAGEQEQAGPASRAFTKLLVVAITLLALAIRLPGLGSFMTADEENWMLRSGVFWHELFRQGDPTGTFITTHPGVTTMWLAGAGITWQESRLGFDIDTSNIRHFRYSAVLPITATSALLIGLATWAAIPLLGLTAAAVGGLLLAIDPYLVGMSQVVHLDALLGLFMLCALLYFLRYIKMPRRVSLVASGILTGAALATKFLPALWLLVIYAAILGTMWLVTRYAFWFQLRGSAKIFAAVSSLALLTVVVLWPAIWSQPDVFKYFRKETKSVVTQQHVQLEESSEPLSPASFYPRTVLARTTPLVLLLVAGSIVVVGRALSNRTTRTHFLSRGVSPPVSIAVLLLYAIGFLVLVSFIAKKGDRYAVPALTVLPLVAGWALVTIWPRLISLLAPLSSRLAPRAGLLNEKNTQVVVAARKVGREEQSRSPTVTSLAVVAPLVLSALLIAQTLLWIPHTIAYSNHWLDFRSPTQQGWGEGLEEVAAWLNQHPLADQLFVATWYPRVLGHYFRGNTMSLSSRHDDRVGFIVTYRNMGGREQDDIATNVLQELQGETPAHTVFIGDEPYAWIYEKLGLHYFPQITGELYGEGEVGQTVTVPHDNWQSIHIGLATFSSRDNTQDVVLHVRDNRNATHDLRTVQVNARAIADSSYHHFTFDPIPASAGKTFYLALSSPTSHPGDAVTVRFSPLDILPGQMILRRRALAAGESNEKFIRDGDVAYRLD